MQYNHYKGIPEKADRGLAKYFLVRTNQACEKAITGPYNWICFLFSVYCFSVSQLTFYVIAVLRFLQCSLGDYTFVLDMQLLQGVK